MRKPVFTCVAIAALCGGVVIAQGGQGRGRGGDGGTTILEQAPKDHAIPIPMRSWPSTSRTWTARNSRRCG